MKRTGKWLLVAAGLLAIVCLAVVIHQARDARSGDVGLERRLPDGASLRLERIIFTATNVTYSHQSGPRWLRPIASLIPPALRYRLNLGTGGSFGFGGDDSTNLFVVTLNRNRQAAGGVPPTSIQRLRVSDGQGNNYDACWGANTLGMAGETVQGWQVRAFPRRSPTLALQFLAHNATNGWICAAEFHIPNPGYSQCLQWNAESIPASQKDGPIEVTLRHFQSGAPMAGRRGSGDPGLAARKTRLVFTFSENGKPSGDWQIQKLTISDPTGNRWYPYLDFFNQDFNWVTNGTVEFFGALWPGEHAWKLEAEVDRTAGFNSEDLWEVPLQLPARGQAATLTNEWKHLGLEVKLAGFASPQVELPGDLKWVAKWWGENATVVYALGLRLDGKSEGKQLSIVSAVDETGKRVKVLEHRGQGYGPQAIFLRPPDGATQLRMIFALQNSHFFNFLARPQFVDSTNQPPD